MASTHLDIRTRALRWIRDDTSLLSLYAPTTWAATTAYSLNAYVRPTSMLGRTYKCTSAGTSAGTAPTFPTQAGLTVVDGTVTWTEDSDDVDRAILIALTDFSYHVPKIVVSKIAGNNAKDYLISTTLTTFDVDFSVVENLEYPIDKVPACYLARDLFDIYTNSVGIYLRLINLTLSATDYFNVEYTVARSILEIPLRYEEIFIYKVASIALYQLAIIVSKGYDSSISNVTFESQDSAKIIKDRATELERKYNRFLGIADNGASSYFTVINKNRDYPLGQGRLTHSRLYNRTR